MDKEPHEDLMPDTSTKYPLDLEWHQPLFLAAAAGIAVYLISVGDVFSGALLGSALVLGIAYRAYLYRGWFR